MKQPKLSPAQLFVLTRLDAGDSITWSIGEDHVYRHPCFSDGRLVNASTLESLDDKELIVRALVISGKGRRFLARRGKKARAK